jgi:hypothetical protein
MSVLLFVCPVSDREVSSKIDVDDDSFRTLRLSEIKCPDCNQTHNLFNLSLRLSDEAPTSIEESPPTP